MSQQTSSQSGPYRKPRADLYTVMLLVAWLALVVGIVFLYLETQDYGSPPYKGAPSATVRAETPAGLGNQAILPA